MPATVPSRRSLVPWFPSSSLDPREHEAVDELPLEREKGRQERQRHQKRSGGEQTPFLPTLGARGEARKADGERAPLRRIDDHQRPQELVPMGGDRDDREGDEAGPGERQEDVPQHLPPARALDQRRLLGVPRNRLEGLAPQRGAE